MKLRILGLVLAMCCPVMGAQADTNNGTAPQTQKQKLIARLPAGSTTVLDQAYVEGAKPGSRPDSKQTLDLYVPAGKGPFPVVLWIHGGGWHGGDKEGGAGLALQFVPAGFALASVDYRYTYDAAFPAQIEDCNAALVWLRKHAEQYHLDADLVGVAGHSAGAHLAALMAVTGDGPQYTRDNVSVRVQAAVCWAGPFDLDRVRGQWPTNMFAWNPKDPFNQTFFPGGAYDEDFARKASPVSYIHAGVPPMLIVHGGKDTVVPLGQASAFAASAEKAGAKVTFRVDPDHGHDVMNDAATKEAIAFFKRTIVRPDPLAPDYSAAPLQNWEGKFEAFQFKVLAEDGHVLPYRYYRPSHLEAGQKYPLVLFLHGAGERGIDNRLQFFRFGETVKFWEKYPCFVIAPQCPPKSGGRDGESVWVQTGFGDPEHTMKSVPPWPMRLAMKLLDQTIAENAANVDMDRIYVTGLSMGGFGTWDILQREPGRFAAAMPVCGGADLAYARQLAQVPLWVFHGSADTTVQPRRSRDMVAALTAVGGHPKYTEYPNVGHDCWSRTYSNPEVWDWLFAQTLNKH